MELSSGEVIPELDSGKGYKYIGILEANDIMHIETKYKIGKEYYSETVDIIKLNIGNTIWAIHSWAKRLSKI